MTPASGQGLKQGVCVANISVLNAEKNSLASQVRRNQCCSLGLDCVCKKWVECTCELHRSR